MHETMSMFKDPRIWVAIGAGGLGAWLLAVALVSPRRPAVAKEAASEIRYVCRESGEVFTRPLTAETLAHPETGRMTLVPAIFDAKKNQWRPGPPLDVMRKKGLLRPAS
jgi:hypothetical protein